VGDSSGMHVPVIYLIQLYNLRPRRGDKKNLFSLNNATEVSTWEFSHEDKCAMHLHSVSLIVFKLAKRVDYFINDSKNANFNSCLYFVIFQILRNY